MNGELHKPAAFTFAVDVISAGNEFTKRPDFLRGIIFHGLDSKSGLMPMLWGQHPIAAIDYAIRLYS